MKVLQHIFRILTGLVFMFSGFVKGIDPLGTAYKIEDYFYAYHTEWAIPLALTLSIILCAFEFTLGVMLILNLFQKLSSWLVLIMMSFFTVITFFDAINNPVPDCGCFGDAIKLTNWETFYKNIVLMVLVLVLFIRRNKKMPSFCCKTQWITVSAVVLSFVLFSVYNYRNLPMIDFLPWKVGTKMMPEKMEPIQNYVTYKNKTTGEKKEYLSSKIPWQDSVWMSNWEFLETRQVNPNKVLAEGFGIIDQTGMDVTNQLVNSEDYIWFVAMYSIEEAPVKAQLKTAEFINKTLGSGIKLVILTSSSPQVIAQKQKDLVFENGEFCFVDDISLKMMVRSNPGFVLLKNATVLGKWHWRNVPDPTSIDYNALSKKYIPTPKQ